MDSETLPMPPEEASVEYGAYRSIPPSCARSGEIPIGDLVDGISHAPLPKKYRVANLTRRRRAVHSSCHRFPRVTEFKTGQIQLRADTGFKLPIMGGFAAYADPSNVAT